MPYSPTTWQDRVVQYPARYSKTGETASEVTLTASPGTVTQAGTPLNATNMNKIESGISAALPRDGSAAMTGQVVTVAGTVSAPAIAPTGDSNTGIFFPSADTIAFTEGGAEVMRITSTGVLQIAGTGTQTTPIITNSSDSDTGIYWAAADKLAFTEGGKGITLDELKMMGSMGGML